MDAEIPAHESPTGRRQIRRWAILVTMLLGTTLAILDSSVLNVLVVPLMEVFQADLHMVKWALTSYNVVLAMGMIGFGSLGDTVGRRRLYVLGQVVFVDGSVLAAGAGGLGQLIASRALQVLGERGAPVPLLDLGIILQPAVIATHVAVLLAVLTMTGGMFLSVLYAQLLTDATPATIGVLLAPCALSTFAIAPIAAWLAEKVGLRVPVVTGLLVLTVSVAFPALWHPASAAALVFWNNLLAGTGLGLATPALLQVSTEAAGRERAGMGAGVYKTVKELGGVFGVALLSTFLEGRIVGNALQQLPGHFLPQELSLKTITSLKLLETHAVQKGLALQDLESFHRALVEAVQGGFTQVFGLAALLAGIGVVAGLIVPRQLGAGPTNVNSRG